MLKEEPAEPVAVPRLELSDRERDTVAALLHAEGMRNDDGPLIVFNPNAHDRLPLRKWPVERFAEIGRRIIAETPTATIAISGTAAERDAANDLRRQIDPTRVINLAGRTTLRQAIVLYGMAEVVLTNDSGPAHFASLTETNVVALFGPETPTLYGPVGRNARSLWAGIACSPCVNVFNHRFSPCTNNVCMQTLTVDTVYAEVRRHTGSASRRAHPRNATAGR
jgi:ADP-heptose:LPS heptosyltransferase